ncbi:MAG: hypothetical protein JNK89_07520, partial [Saprospiraceae bacterium]|nr:hypothetical protein [Saprospiraceae bacterium]
RKVLETPVRLPDWDPLLAKFWLGAAVYFGLAQVPFLHGMKDWYRELFYLLLFAVMYRLRDYPPARLYLIALFPYGVVYLFNALVKAAAPQFFEEFIAYFKSAGAFAGLWMVGFGIYAFVQNKKEQKQRQEEEARIRRAEIRKAELEHLVVERTAELSAQKSALEKALDELKSAQVQLVHSEKMASLGELTAGIAHEIQNPLNFVNNFSELSVELAQELQEEMAKPEPEPALVRELLQDLAQNQEKINYHGKRAANIVTAMLQHARTSTGKKEPTDLNLLADEYLRLAYHGLRAKDKTFNAKMVTELDPGVGVVDVIPQDLGRVFLNLINNAFYAVYQKKKNAPPESGYEPTVTVVTRRLPAASKKDRPLVEICIRDNGMGIPEALKAKIFQPFFTTKPTGQGTGLGLSLAFDIVTKGHGGAFEVESAEGEGTEFTIRIPAVQTEPTPETI